MSISRFTAGTLIALAVTAAFANPAATVDTASAVQQISASSQAAVVHYRYVDVDGHLLFYREAGDPSAPSILLLHGFPTSSHMYRNLIPLLADRYHVVAPDLPGFGFSDAPDRAQYEYTFENLTKTIDRFTQVVGLQRYAIQVFDYGAPIGLRLG